VWATTDFSETVHDVGRGSLVLEFFAMVRAVGSTRSGISRSHGEAWIMHFRAEVQYFYTKSISNRIQSISSDRMNLLSARCEASKNLEVCSRVPNKLGIFERFPVNFYAITPLPFRSYCLASPCPSPSTQFNHSERLSIFTWLCSGNICA